MKYLIKLFIIGVLFSINTGVFAQRFGIKAGMNLSDMRELPEKMAYYNEKTEMKYGFHAGATAEFPITAIFSFETGVLISSKGYKSSRNDNFIGKPIVEIEEKTNTIYLEIPLTAKASVDIGKASIYGVFGPYLALGIGGSVKYEVNDPWAPTTGEYAVEWGNNSETNDFKRLDFGLTMGAGVEIQSIQIGVS